MYLLATRRSESYNEVGLRDRQGRTLIFANIPNICAVDALLGPCHGVGGLLAGLSPQSSDLNPRH